MKRGRRRSSSSAIVASSAAESSGFQSLTRDALLIILGYLPLKEAFVLARINKSTRERLASCDALWNEFASRILHEKKRCSYAHFGDAIKSIRETKTVDTQLVELLDEDKTMRCVMASATHGFVGEKTRGFVHAFSLDKRKLETTFVVKNGDKKTSINSLAVLADGSRVFAGCSSPSKRVHCFDFADGQELCSYGPHVDSVFAIACNSHVLVSGGGQTDCEMHVCDVETQASLFNFVHGGSVRGLDIDGNMVISGSLDGRVRRFDLRTTACVDEIRFPSTVHTVKFAQFDPDQFFCSTGRSDNSVYRGKFGAGFEACELKSKHKNGVSSVLPTAFSTVSADYDGTVIFQNGGKKPIISKTDSGQIHALAAASPTMVFHATTRGVLFHGFK